MRKVQVIASEQVEPGEMIIVDGASKVQIDYDPSPMFTKTDPLLRLLYCHPDDVGRIQDALKQVEEEEAEGMGSGS